MAIDQNQIEQYIRYANQNATRSQPLSPELLNALGFLPDLGVTMEVFSGGQPGEGPDRVGSHRHDHGGAADAFFYKDGHRLDWANPSDRPIFEDIVRRGKAAGLTGFGAGDGYMQPASMHIGFGDPAVWGAGGQGENAPGWLRAAYEGSQSAPSGPQAPGTPAPAMAPPVEVASHPVAGVQGGDSQNGVEAPKGMEKQGLGSILAAMAPSAAAGPMGQGPGGAPDARQASVGAGDPMGATMAALEGSQAATDLRSRLLPDVERLMGVGKRASSSRMG